MSYEEAVDILYECYKRDWCKARGYSYEAVELANQQDIEYHGEMFACKQEFESAEMQDDKYMSYLVGAAWYLVFADIVM